MDEVVLATIVGAIAAIIVIALLTSASVTVRVCLTSALTRFVFAGFLDAGDTDFPSCDTFRAIRTVRSLIRDFWPRTSIRAHASWILRWAVAASLLSVVTTVVGRLPLILGLALTTATLGSFEVVNIDRLDGVVGTIIVVVHRRRHPAAGVDLDLLISCPNLPN